MLAARPIRDGRAPLDREHALIFDGEMELLVAVPSPGIAGKQPILFSVAIKRVRSAPFVISL
jgi:hypothetical protein